MWAVVKHTLSGLRDYISRRFSFLSFDVSTLPIPNYMLTRQVADMNSREQKQEI